ncbi:adenylate/guanylate cyclase domain-containing protein [Simiduia sp. 21SJ11W-1]|uniref:adenylate/guanylate cyclase domain-containing protein n=1 Tax=Simiduia sp. 21SJ11W-1 TaxID=2909669 RepID=UPI0020A2338C|nr:adenylate/guanylate cyclase domain-containing protein [Simiduia sp. 21SJ11W-1]UTA49160.1 adenylate/guanylate cyclase domain-containing protein [Simiduia sp. 21SJ11W-1]
MPNSSRQCAVMFADVCGSSSLYKELGNHAAEFKIRQLLQSATAIIAKHQGVLIKTIGDEVMACFSKPGNGLQAATDIQRLTLEGSLQLRIGLCYGEVIEADNDLFGETVNDAAFVAKVARAEEIILSARMFAALPAPQQALCSEFDRVALKGGAERSVIYRAQWQPARTEHQATQVMSLIHTTQQVQRQAMEVFGPNIKAVIAPEHTPFYFGRAASNTQVVDTPLASREHCHLLYRRGKFVLVDHSTNGTYVTPEGQREIYLRREELPLEGCGLICLGSPAADSPLTLTYRSLQAHS